MQPSSLCFGTWPIQGRLPDHQAPALQLYSSQGSYRGTPQRALCMQVSWGSVLQGAGAQSQATGTAESAAVSSLAWLPDGSGVAVMDCAGRLALLDIHGAIHVIQPMTQLKQKQAQVSKHHPYSVCLTPPAPAATSDQCTCLPCYGGDVQHLPV